MQIDLKPVWRRFESLTAREKLITSSTFLVALWAIWDHLLFQPLQQQQQQMAAAITKLETSLQAQQELATRLLHNQQTETGQQKLAKLEQSVANLKQQLTTGEKKFVSPDMMASALRDILQQHGNLQLVKLETLPPRPFGSEEQQPIWVYRHTLAMTLKGDFFSTLQYLRSLESLAWRVHWDSIDYRVTDYPLAETRIQVYTLSFEKDWLGA